MEPPPSELALDQAAQPPAPLAHHFQTIRQQHEAGKFGMWMFLATELLLFGGLFCLYAVYRGNHPAMFRYGHRYLDVGWGTINTAVLIFSSFTMAMAVWAAQTNRRRDLVLFLALTLMGGMDFLGVKAIEYAHKFHDNLVWGLAFYRDPHPGAAAGAAAPAPAVIVKAGDPAKGRDLFRNTCAVCHGPRGEGIAGQGKDMRGSAFISGLDDAGLLAFLQRGRTPKDALNTTGRLMPARGGNPLLSDANLLDIIAHVRRIASGAPTAATATAARPAAGPAAPPARTAETELLILTSVIPPAPAGPPGLAAGWERPRGRTDHSAPPPDPRRDPDRPANAHLFFGFYFLMTGLHGLHVLVGVAVIAWLLVRALRGRFGASYYTPVDLGGLYWHLVDVIWIFLFPLFYLVS